MSRTPEKTSLFLLFNHRLTAAQEADALGLIPIYSTPRREMMEKHMPDGSVHIRHIFSHVRYRRYKP